MATYKVIQDIEAEDKLLGPLTLRQFIYAAIVAVSGFIAFKLAFIKWFLALPFIPHMILFSILAAPFGHDQSSEVWLLAKIRFFLKPHRRIWDQSGVKQLVTITAPKKVERRYTNGLSQDEVQSRLHALAATIDSRGWAIKNVNVNLISQPSYILGTNNSDRLIDPNSIAQEVPNIDVTVADDMLDERNNPTAQNLDRLINDTAQKRREELISKMQHPEQAPAQSAPVAAPQQPQPAAQPADFWFMNGTNGQAPQVAPGFATFDHNPLITPSAAASAAPFPSNSGATSADEAELLKKIKEEKNRPDPMHSHLKTILPLSEQERMRKEALERQRIRNEQKQAAQTAVETNTPPVTATPDPAILELANNDDLNVATIARQANKAMQQELEDGEIIINLH